MSRFLVACALVAAGCSHNPTPAAPHPDDAAATEVMVISTIHKGHLVQKEYPLGMLHNALVRYKPDLVLVEIRPETFATRHYEDGPFEMTYVTHWATAQGAAVEPIDWWREQDMESAPAMTPEEERALEAELAAMPEPPWPGFRLANQASERARGMKVLNAQARYAGGNAVWNRRQAWFNHRAVSAIERHHARRALAFVGFNHGTELESYLRAMGLRVRDPLTLEAMDPAASNEPAPDAVVSAWREGLGRIRDNAEAATGESKLRMRAKARYFEIAVERRGTCCVPESELKPR
ncbi:MAG: hypothetical protein HY898_28760 [Deltaproteobacteria bacterium]|nr:hypothetical protein [Deltaproteobacteria bacterium]